MAILELSAAFELSIEIPIDKRIAAPKNKSVKHKVLFILSSRGVHLPMMVAWSPYLEKLQQSDIIAFRPAASPAIP
jgi:hypothetical protein